jgi:hypothetical protein
MRRPAFLLATAAVAWGAGFFGWSLLGTAYSNGDPLAHAGDPIQVALAALPLAVAAAAWWSLHRACASGARLWPATSIAVAWLAFSLVSAASVGLLLAPAALLLVGATATVRRA